MIRLLALAAVIATPSVGFAAAPIAASAPAKPPPARAEAPKAERQATRIVASHLREMQAFEYRPARNYEAPVEGFGIRGTKIGFLRAF